MDFVLHLTGHKQVCEYVCVCASVWPRPQEQTNKQNTQVECKWETHVSVGEENEKAI